MGLPEIIQMQDAAGRGRALSFLESQPVPVKTLQFRHHFSIDRTRSGTVDLPRACFEFKSMLHRPTHTTTVQARIASGLSRCTDQPPTYLSLWFGLSLHFHFQHHTFTMAVVRLHECAKKLLRRLAGRMASCCSRRRRRSVPLRTAER